MAGLSTAQVVAEERAALAAAPPARRIRDVIAAVSAEFNVPVPHILSARRVARIALARQVAMCLAVEVSGHGSVTIGRVFNRDGSTVRYAHHTLPERCAADPDLARRVAALRAALTTTPGVPA